MAACLTWVAWAVWVVWAASKPAYSQPSAGLGVNAQATRKEKALDSSGAFFILAAHSHTAAATATGASIGLTGIISSCAASVLRCLRHMTIYSGDMTSHNSPYKSKGGFGRLFNALRYSAQGLGAAVKHEAAFRQELLLVAVLAPLAIWISRTMGEALLLIGTLVLVLIVELINSALEALADTITLEHHPMIGRAKDLGSAAVMLAIVFCTVTWLCIIGAHMLGSTI